MLALRGTRRPYFDVRAFDLRLGTQDVGHRAKVGGRKDERMEVWVDGWTERWTDGRMEGWVDGRVGGWMDG